MNNAKICVTCGTKYPQGHIQKQCMICADDRQYIPLGGQKWIDEEGIRSQHHTVVKQLKSYLYEIQITPTFGIGQRAFLVVSPTGNILWDCIPLMDRGIIDFIDKKGGLKAITISHPHYYSNMTEWADQFDCPIILPETEKKFVVFPSDKIEYWNQDLLTFWDGIQLIRIGGHFPGSSVLRIPTMSSKGVILCGDTFYLSLSMQHFSVMYSYPNRIPIALAEVRKIELIVESLSFDEIYGFWPYQNLTKGAKKLLLDSLARYR